jgi:hypothetical protein
MMWSTDGNCRLLFNGPVNVHVLMPAQMYIPCSFPLQPVPLREREGEGGACAPPSAAHGLIYTGGHAQQCAQNKILHCQP